ncbi:PHD finger protein 7-like [Grus japonensis]|uniref:PHD finger protein 7-like n=1 Tax=Grus japonensis TaxID=30415 RepID=A0ABC9XAI5_GRUJA
MFTRKEKALDSMEQACMLCRRAEADPDICGRKLEKQGLWAHEFCLFFGNGIFQLRSMDGVHLVDIRRTIEQATWKDCFVCGKRGATITCRETGCNRSFHLPCAVEGECITQYFGLYRKEKALDSMEQACMLCRRAEADPDICGRKLEKQGLWAHVFCLDCFVCGKSGATITCRETGCDRSFHLPCAVEGECITQYFGLYRSFCWEHRPEQAVQAAPEETTTCLICMDSVGHRKSYSTMVCPACKHAWFHRGCIQDCFVCGENGATITCRETGCDRSFHLPCAVEGECITQYFGLYRSFCWEHRPEQAVQAAPEETTTCLICMDSVGHRKSYSTMVCPACKHAWFHRGCIQDCFVCGENGATITCQDTGCDRSFHLPCAVEGECITQYFGLYRSFCWEHRPEQAVQAAPEETTTCLICMDSVGHRKSYSTMVCPACKHAWFHRGCIQPAQIVLNGRAAFRCVSNSSQFGVTGKLAEGTLCPLVQVIDEYVEKEKALDSMEQACMLCHRTEADPDIYGRKLEKHGLCAHVFCLFFANDLFQQQSEDQTLMGFLPQHIRRTIGQAIWKDCFVCGENGATITCQDTGCDRSFHLPCAVEGECITQYFGLYRSFCWEHRPEQAVQAAPEETTTCLICMDSVGHRKSYSTMVCPACKHAWFHRGCIQVIDEYVE